MNNKVSITAKQTTTESCTAVTVAKFTNMMSHSIFQKNTLIYMIRKCLSLTKKKLRLQCMKTHAHRQCIKVYLIPKRKTTKLCTDIS